MRTYEYDDGLARQANTSNFIDETGKYIGFFTLAEAVTSRNGSEGVEFTFEDDAGRTASFLQLWTYNKEGKPLYGLKVFNALLRCIEVRGAQPKPMTVDGRDGNKRQVLALPELMNKPIGLLLQKEFYNKNDGSGQGWKMSLHAPFHAKTEMTALELSDRKTTPEALPGMIARLADKPAPAPSQRNGSAGPSGGGYSENLAEPW